jgi:hypothetical protein
VGIDRRNKRRREEVIRSVVDQIIHNPKARVTIHSLKEFLKLPDEGAQRIIEHLVNAGVLYEVSAGVWTRVLNIPSSSRPYRRSRKN